jgi:hypothetical protein
MTEANTCAHRSYSYPNSIPTTATGSLGKRSQSTVASSAAVADHSAGGRGPSRQRDCGATPYESLQSGALEKAIPGARDGRFAPRCHTPGPTAPIDRKEIIRRTTQEKPDAATHWSTRSLARSLGTSAASVQRVWRTHGLKPHRVGTFKLSRDPHFQEKLEDIVGLYINPPQHALVFSVDEKSQIQALQRTQPGLPMKKGRAKL